MSTLFTQGTDDASTAARNEARPVEAERIERPAHRPLDSNAVRWVLAATIAFWLAVYAVGHSYFS